MDNDNFHNLLNGIKSEMNSKGISVELPHMSGKTLGTVYTKVTPESLTAKFQFNPIYNNPFKRTQGGIICAYMDEVFGPLSFLVAKRPVVTLDLNTTFIRPFEEKDESVFVTAELVSQSKSLLVMKAEVKTKEGKLIAIATSHSMILSDEQLSRKPS